MKARLAIAAACAVGFAPPADAHYYPGCQKRACKRHVIKPYKPWLAKVRYCEWDARQRWRSNTGNGFFGAYQFTLSSYRATGGYGYPHLATPVEQSYRAVVLLRLQGVGAWPVCGA